MVLLGVSSVWAEQVEVTLSAPNNTSNPLVTQTMGSSGGEKTIEEAWKGGEDSNTQQALMINQNIGTAGSNQASIVFSSPDYTILHKYSFNVWTDWISKKASNTEINTDYKLVP